MLTKSNQSLIESQTKSVHEFLKQHIATASMISNATGIPHKNICRYKRQLQKEGLLWEMYKEKCRVTGHRAWYLTTDPETYQSFEDSNIQYELPL